MFGDWSGSEGRCAGGIVIIVRETGRSFRVWSGIPLEFFLEKKEKERKQEGPRFFGGTQKYVWGRREMTRNAKNGEEEKGWRANKLVADALTAYAETKWNESAASAPNDVIIAGRINAPYFANDFSSFYAFVRRLFSSTRRPPQRKEITFPDSPTQTDVKFCRSEINNPGSACRVKNPLVLILSHFLPFTRNAFLVYHTSCMSRKIRAIIIY